MQPTRGHKALQRQHANSAARVGDAALELEGPPALYYAAAVSPVITALRLAAIARTLKQTKHPFAVRSTSRTALPACEVCLPHKRGYGKSLSEGKTATRPEHTRRAKVATTVNR